VAALLQDSEVLVADALNFFNGALTQLASAEHAVIGHFASTESVGRPGFCSSAHGSDMSFGHKLSDEQTRHQPQSSELMERILVVEDDLSVQRILKRLFESEGFAVEMQSDGQAGLDSFYGDAPSATILDLNLPKLSGKHLCRTMKATAPSIPIIVLTASCDLHDKVALLEMGADDYMTKPFSPRELLARLRVALRHTKLPARVRPVVFDGIVVDFGKVEVTRNRTSVELTAHEFKTLQFFIQNPDRVITRAELLKQVCGYGDGYTTTRSIDNHIMKLRHKLEEDPGCPTHFRTVPRLGYKFTF
jgi:DNA-binding response OmpR family regulator